MSHPPFVHPEYRALLGDKTPTPAPPATDLSAIRATINAATQAASDALPFPAGMTTTVSTVTSTDGTEFKVTRFVPLSVQWSSEKSQRAVIYGFGGGLIAGSVEISFNMIAQFAEQTETQVFAPDYRLAPEHPWAVPTRQVPSPLAMPCRLIQCRIRPHRAALKTYTDFRRRF
jgi:acetyl esterase/lipase